VDEEVSGSPDIDIDFADRTAAMAALFTVPAMIDRDGKKHRPPLGRLLPKRARRSVHAAVRTRLQRSGREGLLQNRFSQPIGLPAGSEMRSTLSSFSTANPCGNCSMSPAMVEQLPHVHKHYDTVQSIAPKSIEDLAVVLALVRPGKKHLIGQPRST
jgi:hypothetical protein